MKKNLIARTALIIALSAAPIALTHSASAADNPAPGTGLRGACNMLRAFHDPVADTGMGRAMSRAADNGNAGMWHALDVSAHALAVADCY